MPGAFVPVGSRPLMLFSKTSMSAMFPGFRARSHKIECQTYFRAWELLHHYCAFRWACRLTAYATVTRIPLHSPGKVWLPCDCIANEHVRKTYKRTATWLSTRTFLLIYLFFFFCETWRKLGKDFLERKKRRKHLWELSLQSFPSKEPSYKVTTKPWLEGRKKSSGGEK